MPDISFVYAVQAVGEGVGALFAWWVGACLCSVLLALAFRKLAGRRGFGRDGHLLVQLERRRLLNIVCAVLCVASVFWNARLLPGKPLAYLALAMDLGLGMYSVRRIWHVGGFARPAVVCLASALTMAAAPVALSPVAVIAAGCCAFDAGAWRRPFVATVLVPFAVYVSAALLRSPEDWGVALCIVLLAVALACVALVARYRRELSRCRARIAAMLGESDMERRRMDELELGIVRQERENLVGMLDLRRKEARDAAEKLTGQSQFMQEIYGMLCEAQGTADEAERLDILQQMKSKLQLRMNFTDERTDFNQSVEELHKDFSIRLLARYPTLSAQERKLAAMLRLEFPTKYIAVMLNISPKSVEIERHRLRKKLGIDRKTKLTDFIKNI